jgi:hypothetical protein
LEIAGHAALRPRGSLAISEQRELLVVRSSFGAYGPDGLVARETLRRWGDEERLPDFPGPLVPESLPSNEAVVRIVDEPAVWGGCISDHYGHFLTEFVSRLWPLLPGGKLAGLPVVFSGLDDWPFVHDWLNAFGVRTIDIPRRGIVRFKRMYVPEPAWRLNAWVAPEMLDVHRHARRGLNCAPLPSSNVLWLSRLGLDRDRVPYDEALLEWLLEDYVIPINPQAMTLEEQVCAFEANRTVVGVAGSAFHTALMTRLPGRRIYLCPALVSAPLVAQEGLLDGDSTFVHALAATKMSQVPSARRPASYRLMIPEIVRALRDTSIPQLAEDSLVSLLAEPERLASTVGHRQPERTSDMNVTLARVVLDPLSIDARMALGMRFEAEGLIECAIEQFATVADLAGDYALAPLRAAQLLHRNQRFDEAAAMARRVLAIDPESKDAVGYVIGSPTDVVSPGNQ